MSSSSSSIVPTTEYGAYVSGIDLKTDTTIWGTFDFWVFIKMDKSLNIVAKQIRVIITPFCESMVYNKPLGSPLRYNI
jgi:hypothetical protein